jgi:hypothetical protein
MSQMKPSPAWKSDYDFAPLQEPQTHQGPRMHTEEQSLPTGASKASSPNIATLVERLSEAHAGADSAPRPAAAALPSEAAPPSESRRPAPRVFSVAVPTQHQAAAQQPRLPAPPVKTRALPFGGVAAAFAGVALVPMSFVFFLWWQDGGQDAGPVEELAVTVPNALLAAQPEGAAGAPLTAPARLDATAGRTVAFPIAIDAADQLPARSVVAVTGLPEGATLSQGRPYGDAGWSLRPDEVAGLQLQAPAEPSMTDMRLELVAGDGTVLAQSTTQLSVTPPQVATVDPIGTPRLAEAPPAPQVAALAKPEEVTEPEAAIESEPATPAEAAAPAQDAETAAPAAEQVASAETTGAVPGETDAAAALKPSVLAETEADVKVNTVKTVAIAAPQATQPQAAQPQETKQYDGAMALGSPAEEWMETKTAVDMHARAEQKSETVKVADGGLKVLVKARDKNWIQVHDPKSDTTGWIYNRFLKEAEAPAQ